MRDIDNYKFVGQGMTDIEDLAFRPASNVVTDDDGPVRGHTLFADVPYTFERRLEDDPQANSWGIWFDLLPLDATMGLPIRAMGLFRGTNSVRWTSFGSPAGRLHHKALP